MRRIIDPGLCGVVALCGVAIMSASVHAQERSKCPEYDLISYSAPRELLRERVQLEPNTEVGGRFPALRRFEELQSPFRTAHALISRPDTKQRGPWTTVIAIRGNEARPLDLLITIKDHGTGGVRPKWINDKLFAFRVWWGRVVETDVIVNVETSELVYFEEASFQQTLLPCDEKQRLIAERAAEVADGEESSPSEETDDTAPPPVLE